MTIQLSDGVSIDIDLEPDWDFKRLEKLRIEPSISISGVGADYTWTSFKTFSVPLKYVTTSDAIQMNLWWERTTSLLFLWEQSTYSVLITNPNKPFLATIKPYHDLYSGTLEIERK